MFFQLDSSPVQHRQVARWLWMMVARNNTGRMWWVRSQGWWMNPPTGKDHGLEKGQKSTKSSRTLDAQNFHPKKRPKSSYEVTIGKSKLPCFVTRVCDVSPCQDRFRLKRNYHENPLFQMGLGTCKTEFRCSWRNRCKSIRSPKQTAFPWK